MPLASSGFLSDYPFIREIESPVTAEQLRPLDSRCKVVQFATPLMREDFVKLAQFLRHYPGVTLRMYGHYGAESDLEFLSNFRFVTRFQVDVFDLVSFDGLRHLPDGLVYLGLGQTKSKRHSLSFLGRFPCLRELFIEGHTKDFAVVASLMDLRDLTIRSMTLPDLAPLAKLPELRSLAVKLGGTSNLEALSGIRNLRYLELWMIRGLSDLSVLAKLGSLQYLFLQALKRVTAIPSLRGLSRLRRVDLETMKGLNDLRAVADAPLLEELVVVDMPHLAPEAFHVFAEHPRLRAASIGLGSARKNQAIRELLGLPEVNQFGRDFVFQ